GAPDGGAWQAGQAGEPGAVASTGGAAAPPGFVHGSLSMRYRERSTDSERDPDLYAPLDLEMGDTEKDPWRAPAGARVFQHFGDDGGAFQSPESTYSHNLTTQLYEAHLDLRDVPSVEVVSVGRQELVETPVWVRYDGAQVVTAPSGDGQQTYGFYGGRTVHL